MKINKAKIAEYAAEFLGTFILVTSILLSGLIIGGNDLIFQGFQTRKFEPVVIGFTLAVIIFVFGNYSKTHFNPVVTVAMAINRKIRILDSVIYILVQLLGALAAYPLVNWLRYQYIDLQIKVVGAGASADQVAQLRTQLADQLPLVNSFQEGFLGLTFAVEAMFTFVFVLTILFVATNEKLKNYAGFIIGTSLMLVTMLGASISGASYHPFRSFVPAAIERADNWTDQVWVYMAAPLVGAIVAGIVFWGFQFSEGKASFSLSSIAKRLAPKEEEKSSKKEEKKTTNKK